VGPPWAITATGGSMQRDFSAGDEAGGAGKVPLSSMAMGAMDDAVEEWASARVGSPINPHAIG